MLDILNAKHLSGCQGLASQGWGSEGNCAVGALGCTGPVWGEMASAEVIHGNWNPSPSGWYLSVFKKRAYILFYLLMYLI